MASAMANMPYLPRVHFGGCLPPLETIYRLLGINEFRLLQVLGYDSYGLLRCSLQSVEFREDAIYPYTAISYTWNESEKLWYGDYDTSPKPMRINGAAVLVPNKVANIIALAHQHSKTFIWIDAICINQTDAEEKSRQVARMGAVYGYAAEVLSVLGSPTPQTDELLDEIARHYNKPTCRFSNALLMRCISFLTNDYWQRARVFQEIAMARAISICCGSRRIPFDVLLNSITEGNLPEKAGLAKWYDLLKAFRHLKPVVSRVWKHGLTEGSDPADYATTGINSSFLDFLRKSRRHRMCRDPRDVLYSRVALATDAADLVPYVDYQMPVEELYKRFATNCIGRTNSLEVITFANNTSANIATWVPDWSSRDVDWDSGNVYSTLADSLSLLSWKDVGLP